MVPAGEHLSMEQSIHGWGVGLKLDSWLTLPRIFNQVSYLGTVWE